MNRILMTTAAGLLALNLAACSGTPPVFTPPSATVIEAPRATGAPSNIDQVNRGVAAAEQTLTLLFRAATAYTSLPRCDTSAARICSDRETARQIRRYAIQAHNALVMARRNEASVEHVWRAIDLLGAVIPSS